MPRKTDPTKRIIDAALSLAGTRGWVDLTLADIAGAAEVSLADLVGRFPNKDAILAAYFDRVDAAMAAAADGELTDQPMRDRLFELTMARLDALAPHKAAVQRIARELPRDPAAALCIACRLGRSMRLILDFAGAPASGLVGSMRVKGLAAIYVSTLRVWLRDDSEDMSATMAALDKALRRADGLMSRLCRSRRSKAEPQPAASE